jgi:hypothetical protein
MHDVRMCTHKQDGCILAANGDVHQVAADVRGAGTRSHAVQNDVDGPVREQHWMRLLVSILGGTNKTQHKLWGLSHSAVAVCHAPTPTPCISPVHQNR